MERGRPRPQQRTYDRQFSKMSNDFAIWKLLRPRTGALRFHSENTALISFRGPPRSPRLCVNLKFPVCAFYPRSSVIVCAIYLNVQIRFGW